MQAEQSGEGTSGSRAAGEGTSGGRTAGQGTCCKLSSREKERLEAEQREKKERLEAEQREKERLEAERREREVAALNLSTEPPLQVQEEGVVLLQVLKGHEGPVNSVAFSPDGTRIVSGRAVEHAEGVGRPNGPGDLLSLKGHTSVGCSRWPTAPTASASSRAAVTTRCGSGMPRAGSLLYNVCHTFSA